MSDFVMNLARRALGDHPRADVHPSHSGALASQLALPIATAPTSAPPAIGALSSAAPPPLMRQAVAPPPAPPAAAAPPSSMPQSVRAHADPSTARVQPTLAPFPPATPVESPRRPPTEPTIVETVESARPRAPSRPPIEPVLDAARGDDVQARLADARVAAPLSPRAESASATIRIEPAEDGRHAAPRPPRPRVESPLVEPVTPAVPAASRGEDPQTASAPVRTERALERASIAPRLERAADAFGPERPVEASGVRADAFTPREMRGQTDPPVQRRPVEIRIGAIDVRLSSPAPSAPAERPGLAGFEDYAGLRNPVYVSGD